MKKKSNNYRIYKKQYNKHKKNRTKLDIKETKLRHVMNINFVY